MNAVPNRSLKAGLYNGDHNERRLMIWLVILEY
jgi:hypothetical protein